MDSTNNSESVRQTGRREIQRDDCVRISGQAQPLQDEATMGSLERFKSRPWSWDDLFFSDTSPHVSTALQRRWLAEQVCVLKECRAAKTVVDAQLENAKITWQQLRAQYRKSRNQYEASLDPFRPTSNSSVALREPLAYHQQRLETYSSEVRALRQRQEAAHQALDDCLKALSEPIHATPSQSALRPTTITNTSNEFEVPVPADPQPTADTSTSTTFMPVKPSTEITFTDETMVQVGSDVKSAIGQVPDSPLLRGTTTMSPRQLTLLDKYFQVAAEVQILGERLADHNYEYWNAVATREYREDQEELLSIPDEEFEKGHHEERTSISKQLDNAIKEADRLYAECEEEGIDVEANRMARQDDHDASNDTDYQQIFKESLDLIPAEAFNEAEVVRGGTPESDNGSEDISKVRAVVSDWRENIPEDTESPE